MSFKWVIDDSWSIAGLTPGILTLLITRSAPHSMMTERMVLMQAISLIQSNGGLKEGVSSWSNMSCNSKTRRSGSRAVVCYSFFSNPPFAVKWTPPKCCLWVLRIASWVIRSFKPSVPAITVRANKSFCHSKASEVSSKLFNISFDESRSRLRVTPKGVISRLVRLGISALALVRYVPN